MINEFVMKHMNTLFVLLSDSDRFDFSSRFSANLHFNHFFFRSSSLPAILCSCKFLQPSVHDKQQHIKLCSSARLLDMNKSIARTR